MGPPLALGLVLNQEWYRRLAAQAMVGQHGIVSQQPVGEFPVKGGEVVEQQLLVVVHEGLLEGAIEPFRVGVHFRGARVRPPVSDTMVVETLPDMEEELRAVVGEEKPGWDGAAPTARRGRGCRGGWTRGRQRNGWGGAMKVNRERRSPACSRTTVAQANTSEIVNYRA